MEEKNWAEMIQELLDKKQYTKLRQFVAELNEADIADCLEELDDADMIKVFRLLPKDLAAEAFSYFEVENQQMLIHSMSEKEASAMIDNLMADDAVDLLEEMPANMVKRLLAGASPETRRDINTLLRYPEDSAGSIMTVEFVDFKESNTVLQAIEKIRRVGLDSETIHVCYVLDARRELIGTVDLRKLLLSEEDDLIGDIMNENVISVNTLMDQEQVAEQFKKYDFTAMPVVDNENRLVGIITVDDIMDIMVEETTEDMEKMAAIVPGDKPYMRSSVWEIFKQRFPWLLLLMFSATFTGAIISSFEEALSTYSALIAFIPMLMNTGGNAGGQASVTVIRGLSLEEIGYGDVPRVMWKEIRVAFFCGVCLAAANFLKLLLFDRVGMLVALVVCITLFLAVLVAMVIGCLLPVGAKRLGFDPAVMASPFITTIVDALSLMVYFKVATILLGI
ncbi:MAG: magnesium transporter [Lachnospiraceae bacterium]|nr:magnesium transporter [Lachnospiraceae bacterium]